MNDVRMRGFSSRTSVEEARQWVDRQARRLGAEEVSLEHACGRILARPIISGVDVPAFPRAMMDGFAVRADDTAGASDYHPLPLRVIGTSLPAEPAGVVVQTGEAVRIMTGAPMPDGADAVIPVEQTQSPDKTTVSILAPIPRRRHIGAVGEDVARGSTVLPAGRRLRPQDLGVLSSIGISHAPVVRQPRVTILITGNEVLPSRSQPTEYRIADANGPMLAALVTRDHGIASPLRYLPDDADAIRDALREETDVILVSGGSSVGQEDHTPQIIRKLGELPIHGVAMRPSSPAGMGRIGGCRVFLLPGNPVSCLCAYDFFAGRLIRQLAGYGSDWPYERITLPLAEKISSTIGRTDYARVRIEGDRVIPLAIRGASILSSTTRADGFIVIPESSEGFAIGTEVAVYCYESRRCH